MDHEGPSFSDEVKEELARLLQPKRCCAHAELAALVRACGSVELTGGAAADGRVGLAVHTDRPAVARRIIQAAKVLAPVQTEVLVQRRRRLRKNLAYTVRLAPQAALVPLLQSLGIFDSQGSIQSTVPEQLLEKDCCRRSYLRGVFLGKGWVSGPGRGHHLELTASDPEEADFLGQLLFDFGLPVRLATRKEAIVLYLKDAGQVARFLSVVGAHQALLKFEDVRVLKEMKNRVNRQVNADTANAGKTADAAARQVAAIERLRASGSLQRLRPALQDLARLRLAYPEASLKELGEMLMPRVGKSGVNHRMRALVHLGEEGLE